MGVNVPIIIDTNSLMEKGFFHWCRSYRERKVLPIIAYCEYCVGYLTTGRKTVEEIDRVLNKAGIEIKPMRNQEAIQTAQICGVVNSTKDPDFRNKWRDYMIGAYAINPPYLLVTNNIKDFKFLERRVVSPIDIMSGEYFKDIIK